MVATVTQVELDYGPAVPDAVLRDLEGAARDVGLPLEQLELLGQDLLAALRFAASVREGDHQRFLADVDWDRLESAYRARKRWSRTPVRVA